MKKLIINFKIYKETIKYFFYDLKFRVEVRHIKDGSDYYDVDLFKSEYKNLLLALKKNIKKGISIQAGNYIFTGDTVYKIIEITIFKNLVIYDVDDNYDYD